MEITGVEVQRINAEGSLKAYATVTFDDCFVVHNIKIVENTSGLRINMPSRKLKNGEFKNIVHPISSEFRSKLSEAIFTVYNKQDS